MSEGEQVLEQFAHIRVISEEGQIRVLQGHTERAHASSREWKCGFNQRSTLQLHG